jgi:hypothetical protein
MVVSESANWSIGPRVIINWLGPGDSMVPGSINGRGEIGCAAYMNEYSTKGSCWRLTSAQTQAGLGTCTDRPQRGLLEIG